MGYVVDAIFTLGVGLRLILAVILATTRVYAGGCAEDLTKCRLHVEDYKTLVALHQEKERILEEQKSELIKQVEAPGLPGYVWLLTGVLVGGIVTLYIKK